MPPLLVKGHRVNISHSVEYVVFVAITQLSHGSMKVATDSKETNDYDCVSINSYGQ